MVSSAIPIITFRYYPYKLKKLTFWVSLFVFLMWGRDMRREFDANEENT